VPQPTAGLPSGTPGQPLARDLRPPVSLTPSQVADLQTRLAASGFYRGPIDGLLDGPTLSAVRSFQQAARLPVTGLPDAETINTIGVSSAAAAANNFGTPFPINPSNQANLFIQP
jgi:peptidoglycan hydrolase-like protein with peptidoglycan-binding domain